MDKYFQLGKLLTGKSISNSVVDFEEIVIPYLVDVWLTDYEQCVREHNVVMTETSGFSYLFDISAERLLAAWGVSRGRHGAQRDHSRMARHPHSAGSDYHRGHAIPHTLGGPTDINLVPQRGDVNIGPFRDLERQAVATPGALYFTYWIYTDRSGQTPATVDQGIIIPGKPVQIRNHPN
jgi:hypothetical protein